MIDPINDKILNWWYNLPDHLRSNLPTFIHPLNKNAKILFLGLNPSGDTKRKNPIDTITEKDIEEKIKLEVRAIFGEGKNRVGQYKTYYAPLSAIADKLGAEYEHCDLFHMSFRTAKVVIDEIFEVYPKLKPTHEKHLEVFQEVFNIVQPKVVITNNVNSAKIMQLHFNLQFDETTGLYKDNMGTFFYLSGIMSYGRLTVYEKERLIWALKKVL